MGEGGWGEQDASLSRPLILFVPDVHFGIFCFQCSLRTAPALAARPGCLTFAPRLTLQSANSLVSIVVMAAGEDTRKVKPVRSLQSNVQEKK